MIKMMSLGVMKKMLTMKDDDDDDDDDKNYEIDYER